MELPLISSARCELRSVIRFLCAKGTTPIEIHHQLSEVYGQQCMDIKNVRKWCREFKNGRTEVHDEQRSGRPSVSDETIALVESTMLKDRRVTIRELHEMIPEVSVGTIDKILTEHLQYHKVCARWVPKMLSEDHKQQRLEMAQEFLQRYAEEGEEFLDSIVTGDETWVHYTTPETKEQSRQWRHSDSPKPKKFKQTLSAGKVMASVFWDRKGVLLCEFLPAGATINADRYCATLKKLRRAIQNKRRGMLTKGVCFHHDNARPHTAHKTVHLLTEFGWDIIKHAPYSPDLAPSDYHLFPNLKSHLGGTNFPNDELLKEEVERYLRHAAGDFYDKGIKKLPHRLQKCIDRNGDYVEK